MRRKEGTIHQMLRAILEIKKAGLNECDECYIQGYQAGVNSLIDYLQHNPIKKKKAKRNAVQAKK